MDATKTAVLGGGGAIAGIVSKTATAPLERVKMLLQVQAMTSRQPVAGSAGAAAVRRYSGIWGTLSTVAQTEGMAALWQGNRANCARIAPAYAVRFAVNDKVKTLVARPGQPFDTLGVQQLAISGTVAGILQCMATQPLETIRSRLSIGVSLGDASAHYTGILDCGRKVVAKEGVAGLYKGFVVGLAAAGPYVGVQMTLYDLFKRLAPVSSAEKGSSSCGTPMKDVAFRLVAGGAAGIAAQTLVFPFGTVRRRMQLNGAGDSKKLYSSVMDCIGKTMRYEGLVGFYQGCGTNLARAVPGVAIQFSTYDWFKSQVEDFYT